MHSVGAASARHVSKSCKWPICSIALFNLKFLSKQRILLQDLIVAAHILA